MDWEKYTGKKSKPVEYGNDVVKFVNPGKDYSINIQDPMILTGDLSGPATITIADPGKRLEYVDDYTVRIVDRGLDDLACNVFGIERNLLPSFDEVWETVEREIWNNIPDSEPLNGRTIIRAMRLAMRIMYETLTQEQNDE